MLTRREMCKVVSAAFLAPLIPVHAKAASPMGEWEHAAQGRLHILQHVVQLDLDQLQGVSPDGALGVLDEKLAEIRQQFEVVLKRRYPNGIDNRFAPMPYSLTAG